MSTKIKLPQRPLKRLGVTTVYLFGSRAQGIAGPLSDFDFGILLKDPLVLGNPSLNIKLYNELYDLFSSRIKSFVTIDIIFLDQASLQIKYQTIKQGIVLYSENPRITANFKQKVLEQYADFSIFREEFDKLILERI